MIGRSMHADPAMVGAMSDAHSAREDSRYGGLSSTTMLALVAMMIATFLVANDFTALTVAVDPIENDFDTSLNRAQWVINAYTVVFGVMIVTGGRLADMFGRKRAFLAGAAIFAGFSLLGSVAPNIELLIAARALMGVGGALMWPAVLGLLYSIMPEDKAGLAGGLLVGVSGLGNAMGPLIAGALTDAFSWRWVFVINVPITAVAMVVTARFVSESATEEEPRIDYKGIATLSAGVILILVALDQGVDVGFGDIAVVAMFVIGALLLAGFAFVELGADETALMPRDVVGNREFASVAVTVVLISVIYFGCLVYVPQYTQTVLGWSALEAGVGLLPIMLTFAVLSIVAGRLYNVLGARISVGLGASLLTVGIFWLAATIGSGYAVLVPGLIVVGIGVALFYSAVTTAAITTVDETKASLAGGIVYMCNLAGGSIGLGLNTAIVLSFDDFTDGIVAAFIVNGILGVIGAVVAFSLIRGAGTAHLHLPHFRYRHRAHS